MSSKHTTRSTAIGLSLAAVLIHAHTSHASTIAPTQEITLIDPLDANSSDTDGDGVWDLFDQGPHTLILASTGHTSSSRALLEFDLEPLGSSPVEIVDATLRVSYNGASGLPALTLQFYAFEGDGELTIEDAQTNNLTPVGNRQNAFGPGAGNTYYEISITDALQNIVDAEASHAGFAAENLDFNQTRLGGFLNLNPPEVNVTFRQIPEPGTFLVAGCLAALLAGRRRARIAS